MIWDSHLSHPNCFPQHKLALGDVNNDMVDHDDSQKRELEVLRVVEQEAVVSQCCSQVIPEYWEQLQMIPWS